MDGIRRLSTLIVLLGIVYMPAAALAQSVTPRPMATPMPMPSPPTPMPMPATPTPMLTPSPPMPMALPTPMATPTPMPTVPAPAASVPYPMPTPTGQDCTEEHDCPHEGEGLAKEVLDELLKEFAKCEAENKSFDQCLSDDPSPPALASLSDESRFKLSECLGSNDLAQSRGSLETCLQQMQSTSAPR